MPKQTTTIDVPLSGGLQQKTMEPYLEGSQLISAKNAIWTKRNAIEKRPGWTGAGTGQYGAVPTALSNTTIPSVDGIIQDQEGYAITDGTYLYGQPGPIGSQWKDAVPPCVGTRKVVSGSPNGSVNPDVAEWSAGGLRVFVWEDNQNPSSISTSGNTLMYSVTSVATGETVATGIITKNAGYIPRVMILGTYALCVWSDSGASGELYTSSINLNDLPNATWSAAASTSIVVYPGTWWVWDAVPMGVQSPSVHSVGYLFAIVYQIGNGGDPLYKEVCAFNAGAITILSDTAIANISGSSFTFQAITARWAGSGTTTTIWIGWVVDAAGSSANVVYTAYSATVTSSSSITLTQLFAPTTVMSCASGSDLEANGSIGIEDISTGIGGYAVVVHGGSAPGAQTVTGGIQWTTVDNSGSVSTIFFGYNLQLLSRPFAAIATDATYGVHVYATVSDFSAQQSVELVELTTNAGGSNTPEQAPRPCALIAPRLSNFSSGTSYAGKASRTLSSLSSVSNVSNPAASLYVAAGNLTETNNAPSNLSVLAANYDFAHPGRYRSVTLAGLTYIAGGIPSIYDGTNVTESATIQSCDDGNGPSGTAAITGGGLSNGTYSYVFVPEWRDGRGNVSQGPPSSPISIIVGGSKGTGLTTMSVPCITTTQKGIGYRVSAYDQSQLYLVPYRTYLIGGSIGGGATISTTFNRAVGDDPGIVFVNQEYAGTITVTDGQADSVVAASPPLYTTGGLIENDAPSSFADICTHANRVYGIGDDLRTIWISTVQQDGVPCSFSDQSQTEVSSIGDLVAIWSMDDKLFASSTTGIAYATGDGPNLAGQQSNLSTWNPIPTDIGTIDPRAVCVTPIGTVFRHAYGLGLLDRSLSVHGDFGDPVIDLLNTYPTTTAIVQHPTRHEILVFCTSPSNGGVILSFNTRFQSWSSWFINDADARVGAPGTPNVAIAIGGAVQYGSPYGRVWTENATAISNPVAGSFYDAIGSAQTYVSLQVSTGWIKPGGGLLAQGWVRQAMIQFQSQDWHQLTAQVGYDYNGSLTSPPSWVFPAGSLSAFPDCGGSLGAESKLGLVPPMARCGAFRMVYSDAQGSASPLPTTGQGPRIVGLGAMIDALPGQYRLPAVQGG